jgi:hypothetical protein
MIDAQVHNKFKLFVGEVDGDGSVSTLAKKVEAWANHAKVAAKSIGIEYLEHSKQVLLTIGYRDDEPGYGVKLSSVKVGRLGKLDEADIKRLEGEMERVTDKVSRIICHELYVTENNDFSMVFMSHSPGA